MSVNKERPHVYLIPEDDADRELAIGFLNHYAVNDGVVAPRDPAGGWPKVLAVFKEEYIRLLHACRYAHVVMLIDFDSKDVEKRMSLFQESTPEDVKNRVFVIGPRHEPEAAQRDLKMTREQIGSALAEECRTGTFELWRGPHFEHNNAELQRLVAVIKPFVFSGG